MATKTKKKAKLAKRIPKQKSLPGMTDRRVAVLERAALHYADVRDERMEWTKKEVEAKKRVQDLMHKEQRDHYQHANIEISLEPEGEKVIVRVRDRKQEPDVDEPVDQPTAPVEEPAEVPGLPAESEEEPDQQYVEGAEEAEEEEQPL